MGPKRSLKARALQHLAQREQSRLELGRKLLPHAQAEEAAAAMATADEGGVGETAQRAGALARVEAVLDWLTAHDHLSQDRFVESRVHARASRFGNLRIRQEFKQHAVALPPGAAQALKDSEFDRARDVRARKFPQPPSGAAEQAHQMRFLMGRGFSPDVIRRVLRDAASAAVAQPEPGAFGD